MSEPVKVVFLTGTEQRNERLIERMRALEPELPLYVVSEFPPEKDLWIPYYIRRGLCENLRRCRAALRGKRIRLAAILLEPGLPYRRMRLAAFLLAPLRLLFFNEGLDHFMLRPWCARPIARYFLWRAENIARWQFRPGGPIYTFLWRVRHPSAFRRPLLYRLAGLAWHVPPSPSPPLSPSPPPLPEGTSVVIPSRNGRDLLERNLPAVLREGPSEVIVLDNGSDDGTAGWLREHYPEIGIEESREPLSFARAVNRGLRRARFSHVCLLNNDMAIEPGFFAPLRGAFRRVPDLFCATAQIFFPPGVRREETGKAVMPLRSREYLQDYPEAFPVTCDLPLDGEDLSYVLYGSGGCSLYSTAMLRRLGGFDEIYEPAYVEDLDAGVRAWQRGWPTVFAAGARVLHEHRATTSRYFTADELDRILEINYLRFLARTAGSERMWRYAVDRLNLLAVRRSAAAMAALEKAWRIALSRRKGGVHFLPLVTGDVAVFPGAGARAKPVVLVASPYLPFPLSHGGAVRMYNLMRRAAADFDQVLVAFSTDLKTPPKEVLDICGEVVVVRMVGSHARPRTDRPDIVEEFDSPSFRAAMRQTVRKWKPEIAQLEFTQMAQYARDCAPAKTILVEHDITLDLYRQLLANAAGGLEEYDTRQELARWERFERDAWRVVDCVVTMSEQDRNAVSGARAVTLANGVDLERFRPCGSEPDPRRLLFIGSFAHLPNVLAIAFFLNEVWPRLKQYAPRLHVIAGARHRYYLDHYRDRVTLDLEQPGIEVEDFVSDPRPAYRRTTVVVAPLVASAGTNIKIMEAMAMGKAIVSTPPGINGLELAPGRDVVVAETAEEMARAIAELLDNPERRKAIEREARARVERDYDWDTIALAQAGLYRELAETAP